jgi:hypothetical protein
MKHKSEVLKIIEAGMEGDRTKLIAYANLLVSKCVDDEAFSNAIIARITGEYKKFDVLRAIALRESVSSNDKRRK